MNQLKIFTARSVWILILIFSSTAVLAQNEPYHGGSAGGSFSLNSNLLSCNNFRFSGGDGTGDNLINTSLLNCNNFRFFGGAGTGDTTVSTSLLNCNTFRFAGGDGDGFAVGEALLGSKPLGNDTSLQIICTGETFNLPGIYTLPGLVYSWGTSTPTVAGVGTYTISSLSPGGCKDTVIATVVPQLISRWTGAVSADWHDAANWSNGTVPDEKTHVLFPTGTPACQISTANAKAASVQGKGTANLSILNNRVLFISARCGTLPPGL